MREVKLYFRLAGAHVRSAMQHRGSFIMSVVRNGISSFGDLARLLLLGFAFGAMGGWSEAEIAVLYGIVTLSFALASALGAGLFSFSGMVRMGDVDRLMMRPHSVLFQVVASKLDFTRFGRLTMGVVGLVYGIVLQPQPFHAAQYGMIALCIVSGVMLFMGVLLLQGATSFWTVEGMEAFNALTYGGIAMASYPLEIYKNWLRDFFMYIIPLGFLNYLPAMMLFGKELPYPAWMAYMAPVAGGAFLAVGIAVWQLGVRHYRSTGA